MTVSDHHISHPPGRSSREPFSYQHSPVPHRHPGDVDRIPPLIGRIPFPSRDPGAKSVLRQRLDTGITWFWFAVTIGLWIGLPVVGTLILLLS